MHAAAFTSYFLSNQKLLAPATRREVGAALRSRLVERWQAARADSELTFNDLWEQCEREIAPKAGA